MTIKFVVYSWGLVIIGSIVFLFIYVPFFISKKFINGERFDTKKTYSYKQPLKFSFFALIIFSIISALIYFETESFELALSFFVFFIACIMSGLLKTLHGESHLKRRGAIKKD